MVKRCDIYDRWPSAAAPAAHSLSGRPHSLSKFFIPSCVNSDWTMRRRCYAAVQGYNSQHPTDRTSDSQSLQYTAVPSGGAAVRAEDGRTRWLLQFHPAVHTDLPIRPHFPGAGVRVSLYTAALYVNKIWFNPRLPSVAQTADQTAPSLCWLAYCLPQYVGNTSHVCLSIWSQVSCNKGRNIFSCAATL